MKTKARTHRELWHMCRVGPPFHVQVTRGCRPNTWPRKASNHASRRGSLATRHDHCCCPSRKQQVGSPCLRDDVLVELDAPGNDAATTSNKFKRTILNLVVNREIPPGIIVRAEFQRVRGAVDSIPGSEATICQWLQDAFNSAVQSIGQRLKQEAKSDINVSTGTRRLRNNTSRGWEEGIITAPAARLAPPLQLEIPSNLRVQLESMERRGTVIFCVMSGSTIRPSPNAKVPNKIYNIAGRQNLYSDKEFAYVLWRRHLCIYA
ncbi:hypothetical protein M426DRAFT_14990 [Hypoxylon sp. CI-4A]|nr:hypothetical protein M426DRAFT_14990 [Hypoxylon sp. CI-4A]